MKELFPASWPWRPSHLLRLLLAYTAFAVAGGILTLIFFLIPSLAFLGFVAGSVCGALAAWLVSRAARSHHRLDSWLTGAATP
jgi:membrane associated rhomboid family serine protease